MEGQSAILLAFDKVCAENEKLKEVLQFMIDWNGVEDLPVEWIDKINELKMKHEFNS
jgi:hypothetical protein